jgi:Zn-dependent protease
MDAFSLFLVYIVILLLSVVVHEVSHGAVANMLGDPTARLMGRLTLNPLPHIDPVGSVLVPISLAFFSLFAGGGIIFGWAKPVPYNPNNLKYHRWGPTLVALAGPASNMVLALVFGLTLRFAPGISAFGGVAEVFASIVFINVLLAIFNLVPIPPLDGSKLLFSLARVSYRVQALLEQNGFILLLLFIFFGFPVIVPIIMAAFTLITGISTNGLP